MKNLLKQSGYLYIELCIVVLLVSLLIGVSTPVLIHAVEREQMRILTREISDDLYFASNLARTRQTIVNFDILTNQKQYKISSSFISEHWIVPIPSGYLMNSNFTRNRITFDGKGQVSQGGTITLEGPTGAVCRFVVQLATGRFRIVNE